MEGKNNSSQVNPLRVIISPEAQDHRNINDIIEVQISNLCIRVKKLFVSFLNRIRRWIFHNSSVAEIREDDTLTIQQTSLLR